MADMVNHPSHYTNGNIECIDAMVESQGREQVIAYCRLNAFKYIWRCQYKGTESQDMKKAIWYLSKAVELMEGGDDDGAVV